MRRNVLALAAITIVATLGVAVVSRRADTATAVRVEPVPATSGEPEVSWAYTSTPRYDSEVTSSAVAETKVDGTTIRDDFAPADNVAVGAQASKPRKAVGPAGDTPQPERESGTEAEFLSDALFRRLDADGDGVLSGAEIPTALRGAVNRRGAIDREAFTKVFVSTVQKLRAANGDTRALFETLDTDRDGRVSLSEWRAAGRSASDFQRFDTDGDGVLTLAEVQTSKSQPGSDSGTVTPAGSSATHTASPTGSALSPNAGTPSRTGTKPASRADMLFAHYTAIASGSPLKGTAAGVKSAPATAASVASLKPAAPAPSGASAPTVAAPAPAPEPPGEYATLPLPFTGVPYWELRQSQNLAALDMGERPNALFLGDSITDFLRSGAGQPLWDDYYAPLPALDFAVGGIRTSHVLWQVETGQVLMANPKVVVLLIGSNNLGIGQPPEEAAAGVEKIVDELGLQLPRTRVLLIGILPRGASSKDPFRYKIAKANSLIAGLHDGNRVFYLDVGAQFLSRDFSISPDVMPDAAHPSLWGYMLYSVAIWPTLTDLLKQ